MQIYHTMNKANEDSEDEEEEEVCPTSSSAPNANQAHIRRLLASSHFQKEISGKGWFVGGRDDNLGGTTRQSSNREEEAGEVTSGIDGKAYLCIRYSSVFQ